MAEGSKTTSLVYVGTYTTQREAAVKSVGIYAYWVDWETGALTLAHKTPKVSNPSFLILDSRQRFLYAVSEVMTVRVYVAFVSAHTRSQFNSLHTIHRDAK